MVARYRLAAAALAATLASLSPARADGNSRAVIRGSGSDVTIVYKAPRADEPGVGNAEALGVLDEALRLKTRGDDDASIVAFLKLNQASLPDVVDAHDVRELRRAGAGESVIAALSMFSAVDIGETGEGGQIAEPPAEMAPYPGAYPDLVGMGYPFYGGGYGGGDLGSFGGRFGHFHGKHGMARNAPRSAVFRFGQPMFPKGGRSPAPHASRGAPSPHRIR